MILFDKKEGLIDVYALTPDTDKLRVYREKEINEKIPFTQMVYKAITNSEAILERKDILTEQELHFDFNGEYHFFEADSNRSMSEICSLMTNYFNGSYDNCRVVKVLDKNNEVSKYLLVPFYYLTKYYPSFNMKHLNDIISVPKSLYLLQMLLQEKYEVLKAENIDEQLGLFRLSGGPIEQLHYSDFSDCALNSVNASHLILQRKRELIKEDK